MASQMALGGIQIGFIGLGNMGRPMALNLHRAGAVVTVANRSRQAVDELAGKGLTPAESGAEAAATADIVIICVTDSTAVDAILHNCEGVVAGLKEGTLVVDMGPTKVRETRAWAAEISAMGCDYVDAPVSGGTVGARDGTLSIMAGGSVAAFERARPIFEVLGRNLTHVGASGAGQIAKIANQSIVALTIAAVAEALSLAAKAGADPAAIREAIRGGFAESRILELHGERMVKNEYPDAGRSTVQLKDVEQALELAGQVGFDMPSLSLNRTLWEKLIELGHGELDHSALIKIYQDD